MRQGHLKAENKPFFVASLDDLGVPATIRGSAINQMTHLLSSCPHRSQNTVSDRILLGYVKYVSKASGLSALDLVVGSRNHNGPWGGSRGPWLND